MTTQKYEVLEDFKGSPDGRFSVDYYAGEIVTLTDSLAAVALKEGWVKVKKAAPKKRRVAQPKARSKAG